MSTRSAKEILEKKIGPMTFGRFLRVARNMNDLTQQEMAKKLNMSKGGICDIEKGRQFVSIELAVKIAKKFKMSEEMAVYYVITDSIRRAGLKYKVEIKKTA